MLPVFDLEHNAIYLGSAPAAQTPVTVQEFYTLILDVFDNSTVMLDHVTPVTAITGQSIRINRPWILSQEILRNLTAGSVYVEELDKVWASPMLVQGDGSLKDLGMRIIDGDFYGHYPGLFYITEGPPKLVLSPEGIVYVGRNYHNIVPDVVEGERKWQRAKTLPRHA